MKNQCNSNDEMGRVLVALQTLCNVGCLPVTLPPQSLWPKTRHIADFCDMDIYTSRRYLMKLVKNNKAHMSEGSVNNSLRWYIVDPVSLPAVSLS